MEQTATTVSITRHRKHRDMELLSLSGQPRREEWQESRQAIVTGTDLCHGDIHASDSQEVRDMIDIICHQSSLIQTNLKSSKGRIST